MVDRLVKWSYVRFFLLLEKGNLKNSLFFILFWTYSFIFILLFYELYIYLVKFHSCGLQTLNPYPPASAADTDKSADYHPYPIRGMHWLLPLLLLRLLILLLLFWFVGVELLSAILKLFLFIWLNLFFCSFYNNSSAFAASRSDFYEYFSYRFSIFLSWIFCFKNQKIACNNLTIFW